MPGFLPPEKARDFGFDNITSLMARQPGGMVAFDATIPDWDGLFLQRCQEYFAHQPREILIFPDCGDIAQLPLRLAADYLTRFIAAYEQGPKGLGLLSSGADVLLAVDTGGLILVDHDERVWLAGIAKGG